MSFDKARAMRNAERFVAQGKIRAAIAEYRQVVDHDPRDIATLNMLGDLYAKNAEKKEAVVCYLQVADHYNTQGFSQKAIAIYNKISRIQPESIEVSAKLAELHKVKGSLSEARSHYTTLAEHYQKSGKRLEALAMFKQIALLDPNNTDVCMSLADSYTREGQKDEALEAYAEAGGRFSRQGKHEDAIRALMKGFDIKATDLRILNGLVKAQTALGRASKASSLLEEILDSEPYNRDVLYLLIECCIDGQNAAGAEKAVVRLVEIEPANYSKFLDLLRIYLNSDDTDAAARILTMSSEYLLAGGQSDECGKWISEILERDPSQLSALRLLVRYNSWLKDENGFRLALERMYAAAATKGEEADERFALTQLVVIRPHETRYRDRLNEINAALGEDLDISEAPSFQFAAEIAPDPASSNGHNDYEQYEVAAAIIEQDVEPAQAFEFTPAAEDETVSGSDLSHSDQQRIQKELESIVFYIENDYNDLAEKGLAALAAEFGDREEFAELRRRIGVEYTAQPVVAVAVPDPEPIVQSVAREASRGRGIDQIRSEFGLETDAAADADADAENYETHYHTAVAYQEMGLMQEAIREYQEAISLVDTNDGTRRFFQCSNLLGHCFLLSGKPQHALTWFERALDSPNISDAEHHGLWYEIALAHEANGNDPESARFFERIYAEDVDFRDVSERVRNLVAG
jgi:tetratricopeptide (TPR) repeat protein